MYIGLLGCLTLGRSNGNDLEVVENTEQFFVLKDFDSRFDNSAIFAIGMFKSLQINSKVSVTGSSSGALSIKTEVGGFSLCRDFSVDFNPMIRYSE